MSCFSIHRPLFRPFWALAAATVALLGGANTAVAASPAYSLVDLGAFPGGLASSEAARLNDHGQVVGRSNSLLTSDRAFLYDGTLHNLGVLGGLPGGEYSGASDINEAGQIVGGSTTPAGPGHAFFYDGTMHDLGTLGGVFSGANAINNLGQVTGFAETPTSTHLFIYDGVMHDLGSLGGPYINGLAINDSGRITGYASPAGQPQWHAFVYDGTIHDLGTLGGDYSEGTDINASGNIVGHSSTADSTHPFFYDGVMHDLGFGGRAYGINDQNQIVGSMFAGDSGHAFYYDAVNGLVDLNTCIDPSSGWTLFTATDINEFGQIVGTGIVNGLPRAFLLVPVPEPSSWVLAACGLVGAALLSRCRSGGREGHGV